MKGTPAKRSSLFLLELIIAILFFSLTSAVCVQIFVRAHLISRQTQELNMALEKVSGFSEVFLTGDSFSELLPEAADESENADGSAEYVVSYDENWQICNSSDAAYQVQIQIEPQGALLHGTFTARSASDTAETSVIYSMETDYCPQPEQ